MQLIKNNKNQKFTFYQEVGDKIVFQRQNEDVVIIRPNSKFNLYWGSGFVLAGVFISLYLINNGEFKINLITISMILAPGLFFVLVGLGYILKTRNKGLWVIDAKTKTIAFGKNRILPFEEISELKLTTRPDYSSNDSFSNREIHELYIITKRKLSINVFQSESLFETIESGKLLSTLINTKLNK